MINVCRYVRLCQCIFLFFNSLKNLLFLFKTFESWKPPGSLRCRQVALTLIAQQLKDEDLEQLRNTFLVLDKNKARGADKSGTDLLDDAPT